MRVLLLALPLCAAFAAAHAQVYRWTDDQGRVRYGDTVPPGAKNVQKKAFAEDPLVTRLRATRDLAGAKERFPVLLYTSPGCKEPCNGARAALNARSVPFQEVQVWDTKGNEELRQISGGNQVPVVLVGETLVRGFDAAALDAALDAAGYPRRGLLPEGRQAPPDLPSGYIPGRSVRPGELSEPAPEAERTPRSP